MKRLLPYFFAVISGALGVLAFSPFDFWICSYLSVLGLLALIKLQPKRPALLSAFLWALSFFSLGVSWLNVSIHQFGGASLLVSYLLVVLLAGYLSLYPLLFAYLIHRFQVKSSIMFAVLWTATEFLRGWVFTGFPWLQFGYTQIDSPFFGIAPIFGVTGLTFFVVWISALLFSLISSLVKAPKQWNVALVNLALILVIGTLATYSSNKNFVAKVEERSLKITLAQGNIEQNLKWDPDYLYRSLEIYHRLIAEQLGKTDLIILPESALPALENELQPFFQSLQQQAQQTNTEVLIGSVYFDQQIGKLFNSMVAVGNPNQPYQLEQSPRYNKHHLVPFGEYVPMESLLRPLGSVFNLPMSAFQQGDFIQPALNLKQRNFTSAICYEIILGDQLQKNLKPNTDFLLTISNDAWFGDSIGPWQHLQMARMRALELGKPLARATNTGISVFVDEKGKILAQAQPFVETSLTYSLTPTTGKTPYSVLGDKPLYLLAGLFTLLRIISQLIKRKLLKTAG